MAPPIARSCGELGAASVSSNIEKTTMKTKCSGGGEPSHVLQLALLGAIRKKHKPRARSIATFDSHEPYYNIIIIEVYRSLKTSAIEKKQKSNIFKQF